MMPFAKEFDSVYRDAIVPALHQADCTYTRADEVVQFGIISTQIFTHLAKARFCIADISRKNPNVMYELGIAHTLKKDTVILTCDSFNDTPFDVSHYRIFRYRLNLEYELQLLSADILNAVNAILRSSE